MSDDTDPTRFIPQKKSDFPPELRDVIKRMIQDESGTLSFDRISLNPLSVVPAKPRTGVIVYADGVNWDPGSGEGLYRFDSTSVWRFIG